MLTHNPAPLGRGPHSPHPALLSPRLGKTQLSLHIFSFLLFYFCCCCFMAKPTTTNHNKAVAKSTSSNLFAAAEAFIAKQRRAGTTAGSRTASRIIGAVNLRPWGQGEVFKDAIDSSRLFFNALGWFGEKPWSCSRHCV